MQKLNLLLSENQLDSDFQRIANDVMNRFDLCVADKAYQIAELEFYYNHFEGESYDVFAHKHSQNIPNGSWRLHGAGLDIVFKSEVYYGGFLIRGLKDLNSNDYIDGPWNVATTLIQSLGQADEWGTQAFKLKPSENERNIDYLQSLRVGLNLRREEDAKYWVRPWRYVLSNPVETKKYKYAIVLQSCIESKSWEIPNGIKVSQRDFERYKSYFLAGQKMQLIDLIGKARRVETICNLIGACHKNIEIL